MSRRYIPRNLRLLVAQRALYRCEYCRLFEMFSFYTFQIEHIISLKHNGKTVSKNLAYACPICNVNKGSDIATVIDDILTPVRFFNPRIDIWNDHFSIEETGIILPKTLIAEGTIKIFDFNQPDSIIERKEALAKGIF